MENRLEVEYRPVADLIPYARNARTHSEEQVARIAASIREFGWTNPILVDGANGIIAGHGRLAAARLLKMDTVPVIELAGMTDAQKKAYILADNKLALDAGWDADLLKVELEDLKAQDFDLALTGFTADEIERELGLPAGPEEDEDAEVPEPPEVSVTQQGEVWLLGKHRLMCGDATKPEDLAALMKGNEVDLYLTDPPYNVAYVGKTKDALTIENDQMEDEAFREFLVHAFANADSVLKPGGAFYIWHADSEGYNFRGACHDVGWTVRQCLVWSKNSMVLGRQDYQWKHEPCLYGWKDGAGHSWFSDRTQTTVLEFDRPSRSAEHPTMKPVALFRYLMANSSQVGGRVLDTFGGSGTTLIAAEELGRRAFVMELSPHYCDSIIRRWQAQTGLVATRESDDAPFPAE